MIVDERLSSRTSPEFFAESAISVFLRKGKPERILFSKSADTAHSPASLVKIMTCIILKDIERSMTNWGKTFVLEVQSDDAIGGSGCNLQEGDRLSTQDAIANLLLPSSNMTANVVARVIGGCLLQNEPQSDQAPVTRFVSEMNKKARLFGMTNTYFINPSGLAVVGQRSTARDMAKLVIAAMEYHELMEIWNNTEYTMDITGPNARQQVIRTTLDLDDKDDFVAGKTGTLHPAVYNAAIISRGPASSYIVSVIIKANSDSSRLLDLQSIMKRLRAIL